MRLEYEVEVAPSVTASDMKNSRIHPLVTSATFLALTIVTAWLAFVMAQPTILLLNDGVRIEATIVEVTEVHSTDFDGFSPVVVFDDNLGNQQKIQCNFATGQPAWRVGDKLEIIYPPNRPEEARTTHWWDLWGLSIILLAACILFLMISVLVFLKLMWNWARTLNS